MQELFEKFAKLLPDFLKHSKASSKQLKNLMALLDQLNANITAQVAATSENTTAINAAVAALTSGAVSPADIQKAADAVATNTSVINGNTAALNAALNPPQP